MKGIVKGVLAGLVAVLASLWWMWSGSSQLIDRNWLIDFIIVVNGALPVLVFLLGVFILWLEYDEWKIERELKKEEEKVSKKKKK